MKESVGVILAFAIGAICGKFQIPLPAPTHWMGLVLVFAIWLGYSLFKTSP